MKIRVKVKKMRTLVMERNILVQCRSQDEVNAASDYIKSQLGIHWRTNRIHELFPLSTSGMVFLMIDKYDHREKVAPLYIFWKDEVEDGELVIEFKAFIQRRLEVPHEDKSENEE